MSKQSLIWGGVALAVVAAGVIWFAMAVINEKDPNKLTGGNSLRVDVVAPKEPETIQSSGQLAVGELANSYNHEETMHRVEEDVAEEETGTSWNDQVWGDDSEPPSASADPIGDKLAEKSVKITKVPN